MTSLTWEQAVMALRSDPARQELVRDGYYDDPLIVAAERYWQSAEWTSIAALLPPHGAALDVGAGRGIASYALARSGFAVTALEPDPSHLVGAGAIRSLAQETGLSIEVLQDPSEVIPVPDASMDLVFARAVLHHTLDLRAACREFARVLRPGGRLIAVREHVISKSHHLQAFLDAHPLHNLYGGENAFLLEDYLQAIKSAGLDLELILSPLESPINFAPYSEFALRGEVARRLGSRLPLATPLFRKLFRFDVFWKPLLSMLNRIDQRPGRLYSFVASKVE